MLRNDIPRPLAQPEDLNCRIWRYMNLAKFLDMITSSRLYFARLDRCEDPYEGRMSDELARSLKNKARFDPYFDMLEATRNNFFVNCWHVSEFENPALWKIYADQDLGVAVQSNYSRLKEQLHASECTYSLGLMQYRVDRSDRVLDIDRLLFHKRPEFGFEGEARALVWLTEEEKTCRNIQGELPVGLEVPVDLSKLLTGITLGPQVPGWLRKAIESILQRFDVSKEVRSSELYVVKDQRRQFS